MREHTTRYFAKKGDGIFIPKKNCTPQRTNICPPGEKEHHHQKAFICRICLVFRDGYLLGLEISLAVEIPTKLFKAKEIVRARIPGVTLGFIFGWPKVDDFWDGENVTF